MKNLKYIMLFLLPYMVGAQHQLVINNNAFVVLDGNAQLVIENGNPNAILTTGTGGNIVSENENDLILWNIQGNTGTYRIPWTTGSGIKIPYSFEVTTPGVGGGFFRFATYRTGSNTNTPFPSTVTNVPTPLDVIDRFWRMAPFTYTTNPTANLTFTYDPIEYGGGNTIFEPNLRAQRYNPGTNLWINNLGTLNATNDQVTVTGTLPSDLNPWWTLIAPTQDTDGDGIDDFAENTNGSDPLNPCDPLQTPTPTASVNTPVCSGATVNLTASLLTGGTYSWTGPNGFTSTQQNPTFPNAQAVNAGTYSVTITRNNCVSAPATATLVVNPTPIAPDLSNTGPYCDGSVIQLTANTVVGATYSWTGPNSFTSSLQNPTRPATVPNAGVYNATVTVNGCTSPAGSTTVVVNPIPSAPTVSNTGPYCSPATIQLNASNTPGATYIWTGPASFSSTNQNPTIAGATSVNSGTYNVTVTLNGCTSPAAGTSVVVNDTPGTPLATNNGPNCVGQNIQLNVPTVSGATYSWTGPNGFTSTVQNPLLVNVQPTDVGTYSVVITANGCSSAIGSTNVTIAPTCDTDGDGTPDDVDPDPLDPCVPVQTATPTPTNNGPLCVGQTVTLSTATVSGATYAWSGPGGFNTTVQNPTIVLNASTAGIYNLVVTANNCVSAPGSTTVSIGATCDTDGDGTPDNTDPDPLDPCVPIQTATPVATNNGPLCFGQMIQLSTSAVATVYAWTGPNGFTSSIPNPGFTLDNTTIGTYTLTVSQNNCVSAPASTVVAYGAACDTDGDGTPDATDPDPVNPCVPTQTATPVVTNNGPLCIGQSVTLSTANVAGGTYSWTGPNGFTSTLQNPTFVQSTTTVGTYTLTVTANNCVSAPASTTVAIGSTCDDDDDNTGDDVDPDPTNPCIPTQTPTPSVSNTSPACFGDTINLTTTASGTYLWTGPNGFSSSSSNPSIVLSNSTVGSYQLTVTVNNCTSAPATTIVAYGSLCDSDGDGTPDVSDPDPSNPCVPTQTPTPSITNDGPGCFGETVQLLTSQIVGATYSWSGPNGFTSSSSSPSIVMNPNAGGTYTLVVTMNNCSSAPGSTIVGYNATCDTDGDGVLDDVDPDPNNPCIPFQTPTPNALADDTICVSSDLNLSTASIAGATYNWYGPAGFNSTQQNPTISNVTAANSGVYYLTATANNCVSDTASVVVVINTDPADSDGDGISDCIENENGSDPNNPCDPDVNSPACLLTDCGGEFVPNAFSPNNDGENDFIFVHGDCVVKVDFKIFDRWGEVVFETFDANSKWDGTYKGKPMDIGTFAYVLSVELIDGTTKIERGNIALIR